MISYADFKRKSKELSEVHKKDKRIGLRDAGRLHKESVDDSKWFRDYYFRIMDVHDDIEKTDDIAKRVELLSVQMLLVGAMLDAMNCRDDCVRYGR